MAKREMSLLEKELFGLIIGQGVMAILFGIVALFWPGLTVALLIILFSVFVLLWGVVGAIVGLSTVEINRFWWLELIFSLLAIGLAVYMLRNPVVTAGVFVVFIGLTFLVRGLIDLLEGMFDTSRRGDTRLFNVIVGILGVLAGIITFANPASAGVAVVWVVGLYAVLYGALIIGFAFRAQNALTR